MVDDTLVNTKYGTTPYNRRRSFPAVTNYSYAENVHVRSKLDISFRWEEVFLQDDEAAGLGFRIPYGYVIEVSPDLGYKSSSDHFIYPSEDGGNSLLRATEILTFDGGSLSDNGDGTTTATLTSSEFNDLLHSTSHKYYWRAIAIDDEGGRGNAGLPESFYYRNIILDDEWTIDEVISPSKSIIQTIQGTRSTDISYIEINSSTNGVIYPTNTTWRYDAVLVAGENIFYIRAQDIRGNWSIYKTVVIVLDDGVPVQTNVWNTFDEFGLLFGIRRIPGESNSSYRDRILDVTVNTGGLQYIGVLLGAIRELKARLVVNALEVSHNNVNTDYDAPTIKIESYGLVVSSPAFKINREVALIDSYLNRITLNKQLANASDMVIELENGRLITDYIIEDDDIIFDKKYAGKIVFIKYSYNEVIYFEEYDTIVSVRDFLKEMKYPSGNLMFQVNMSTRVSGHEKSAGFILVPPGGTGILFYIGWSDLVFREISDKEWSDTFKNERNNFFGTKYMKYIEQLKSVAKTEWGLVSADIGTWDAGVDQDGPQAALPRHFDTYIGRWIISGTDTEVDSSTARFYNYIDPETGRRIIWSGVKRFKSGVGFDDDLTVRMKSSDKLTNRTLEETKIVVSETQPYSITQPTLFARF